MNQRSAFLEAALRYAGQGWAVFPCKAKDKRPLTLHGFKDGTTDPQQIEQWWQRNPNANVAIVTGTTSGLLVLDIDPRNGGNESFQALIDKHGPLPLTRSSTTGGGGRHLLFRMPTDVNIRCGKLAEGIDVKAIGGYIIGAPSIHPSGGRYQWERATEELPIADCPQWVLDALTVQTTTRVDAADSVLGKRFAAMAMLGDLLEGGKRIVECPWKHQHSPGADAESSTAILPAKKAGGMGAFKCLHSHCAGRRAKDALRALERLANRGGVDREPWELQLREGKGGKPLSSFANLCLILENDASFAGLRYNEMSAQFFLGDAVIDDAAISRFRVQVEKRYEIQPNDSEMAKAIQLLAQSNRFHPVRDSLTPLAWDGTRRIHHVAREVLNVRVMTEAEREHCALLIRRWLIAAVARALRPGCKVDTALILQGEQGALKSTFFRVLGGDYFSDSEMRLDKDAYMLLADCWIYEWAELENVFGRHEVSKIKAFLSSTSDKFRPPFGRNIVNVPRSAIIVGTTNKDEFLHDPTGSRRFWCIPVGKINIELLKEWRDQLLAEAIAAFREGERWWLSNDEEAQRADVAARFTEGDVWDEPVLAYADKQERVTIREILETPLGLDNERMDRRVERRVADILRRAGYRSEQIRWKGVKGRYWVCPEEQKQQRYGGTGIGSPQNVTNSAVPCPSASNGTVTGLPGHPLSQPPHFVEATEGHLQSKGDASPDERPAVPLQTVESPDADEPLMPSSLHSHLKVAK